MAKKMGALQVGQMVSFFRHHVQREIHDCRVLIATKAHFGEDTAKDRERLATYREWVKLAEMVIDRSIDIQAEEFKAMFKKRKAP